MPIFDSDSEWQKFIKITGAPSPVQREWLDFHQVHEVPQASVFEPSVVYGRAGGRDLEALVFRRADVAERAPVMLWVHGGGWQSGSPVIHLKSAAALAALGYVSVSIRYRLCPEASLTDCVADAKCAVRWVRANAASLGADPERIAVGGGSAGGHLAAMLALTPGMFEGDGGHEGTSSAVQGAVCLYPATVLYGTGVPDLHTALLTLAHGDEQLLRDLSPVNHVRSGAPPILTLTGDADTLTTIDTIRAFHDALDQAGAPNELVVYPGQPHGFEMAPAGWPDVQMRVEKFLEGLFA